MGEVLGVGQEAVLAADASAAAVFRCQSPILEGLWRILFLKCKISIVHLYGMSPPPSWSLSSRHLYRRR